MGWPGQSRIICVPSQFARSLKKKLKACRKNWYLDSRELIRRIDNVKQERWSKHVN